MEDRQVTYTTAIDIPINKETSRLFSVDGDELIYAIEQCIKKIARIINKEGFITLERIFRILELRAHPECPHILFTNISDRHFDNYWLSLFLDHDFDLKLISGRQIELHEAPPPRSKGLQVVKEEDPEEEQKEDKKEEEEHNV